MYDRTFVPPPPDKDSVSARLLAFRSPTCGHVVVAVRQSFWVPNGDDSPQPVLSPLFGTHMILEHARWLRDALITSMAAIPDITTDCLYVEVGMVALIYSRQTHSWLCTAGPMGTRLPNLDDFREELTVAILNCERLGTAEDEAHC